MSFKWVVEVTSDAGRGIGVWRCLDEAQHAIKQDVCPDNGRCAPIDRHAGAASESNAACDRGYQADPASGQAGWDSERGIDKTRELAPVVEFGQKP